MQIPGAYVLLLLATSIADDPGRIDPAYFPHSRSAWDYTISDAAHGDIGEITSIVPLSETPVIIDLDLIVHESDRVSAPCPAPSARKATIAFSPGCVTDFFLQFALRMVEWLNRLKVVFVELMTP